MCKITCSRKIPTFNYYDSSFYFLVIPAKAGIYVLQKGRASDAPMDPRLREDDNKVHDG